MLIDSIMVIYGSNMLHPLMSTSRRPKVRFEVHEKNESCQEKQRKLLGRYIKFGRLFLRPAEIDTYDLYLPLMRDFRTAGREIQIFAPCV